jgi:hypothetical protein
MADFAKGGSKEKDGKDKSLHGLMVALAMAGAIAGVAVLFAYAASDGSASDAGTATNVAATPPEQEPQAVENVAGEPVYVNVKYVNSTGEAEKPVNANTTAGMPTYKEVEKPVYANNTQNNNETNSLQAPESQQPSAQQDGGLSEIDLEKIISKRVLDLLDDHSKHEGKDKHDGKD